MEAASVASERLEVQKVRAAIGDGLLKVKVDRGETYLCVAKENLRQTILLLKNDSDLAYSYFSECLGVDYSAWKHERDFDKRFEVIYNLMSLKNSSRIFVKVGADDGESLPTIKDIFLGSEYPEWEIWDLLGVVFEGNERSERFLLPEDWIGHPLRKEVPLGGEDVVFHGLTKGPAVEDMPPPHAGESFDGKTGTTEVSPR
jgi:NADH-quinone oxidoreductase subunit C